ncbi:hypothetical protein ROA7023_00320 [Roseisalinus antarcticus]|uniref:Uncharacterized protein n=1 Tax=Roseisalinus antarcticus TaxID=254357 RepID=A0A1Y5RLR2_9RHOB|nr:hypothetical protein ROA7023_00320 [Roseisalinus antarcticus]
MRSDTPVSHWDATPIPGIRYAQRAAEKADRVMR